jgi:hypothetical protein
MEEGSIVQLYHGHRSTPPIAISFTAPSMSQLPMTTDADAQRVFLERITTIAQKAVFAYIDPSNRAIGNNAIYTCFGCDGKKEASAVYITSSHQVSGDSEQAVWSTRTYAACRCMDETCLKTIETRIGEWIAAPTSPNETVQPLDLKRACYKCNSTGHRCVELAVRNGAMVCMRCRTGVCACCGIEVPEGATRFHCCSACSVPAYCSRECQRKDWPVHKLNCARVKAHVENWSIK